MKNCLSCGAQLRDEAQYCDHCGAKCDAEPKKTDKPGYFQRRAERERETQRALDASYLHPEAIDDIPSADLSELRLRRIGDARKRCIAWTIGLIGACAAIVGALVGVILIRGADALGDTWRVLLLLALFLGASGALAAVIDLWYRLRVVHGMRKCAFAIRKVRYAKPPYLLLDGVLYTLDAVGACKRCQATTHIEETRGAFYTVCDSDRTHIARIDTAAVRAAIDPTQVRLRAQAPPDAHLASEDESSVPSATPSEKSDA